MSTCKISKNTSVLILIAAALAVSAMPPPCYSSDDGKAAVADMAQDRAIQQGINDAERLIEEGDSLYADGKYDRAYEIYRKSLMSLEEMGSD